MMFDQGKLSEMFIILFDDMLLVTRKKKGLSKKVRKLKEGMIILYLGPDKHTGVDQPSTFYCLNKVKVKKSKC